MLLPLSCCLGTLALAAPTFTPAEDGFAIQGQTYRAEVAADGCLTSLQVAEVELLRSGPNGPRGGYFYLTRLHRLDRVTQVGDTIHAESDAAAVDYVFGETGMTWRLTNRGTEPLLYLLVFEPVLSAMQDESGRFRKVPQARSATTSTWYAGPARLTLSGGTRVWGPWSADRLQIWELRLGPGETREVTVAAATASAEEQQRAAATAAYVPPPPESPVGPMWDLAKFSAPPRTWPAEGFAEEGVQALFYEGPPYEGQPTKVFAWLGLPDVPAGATVPGVVLVHGGGGTAFAGWVKRWNERGYAAIAMDTCGCVPRGTYAAWERHAEGGPEGWGGWRQIDWPREDQWTYHAIADAMLAHSLLRAQPGVDPERIGVTGISWGGYLTSILAGVDPRFKFAAPVYGCGFYRETGIGGPLAQMTAEQADRWVRWWDPASYLPQATMPMLWQTGTNDFAFWLPALQMSYQAAPGPDTLSIRLRMPHGHGPGEAVEEVASVADALFRGGARLATITAQGRDDRVAWARFDSPLPIQRAELLYTTESDANWAEREWLTAAAEVGAGEVRAELPAGTLVYFLNIIDQRGLVVSTAHEVLPMEEL